MKQAAFSYRVYHDKFIYLEWPAVIDPRQMNQIRSFANLIQAEFKDLIMDIVPAYHSIAIYFKEKIKKSPEIFHSLEDLYVSQKAVPVHTGYNWKIPVVYGGSGGKDLDTMSKLLNLSPEEIIMRHISPVYEVYFLGFLPGFPYLGGLDPKLHLPRKANPSASIAPGSVAIGGSQTGIYPVQSPGAWHVIGYSPFPLFDLSINRPIVIQSGDKIQFYPIGESEIDTYLMHLKSEMKAKNHN